MQVIDEALSKYVTEVQTLSFPRDENTFKISENELQRFIQAIKG
jgi:ketopantoate hydroxymethyltransferase